MEYSELQKWDNKSSTIIFNTKKAEKICLQLIDEYNYKNTFKDVSVIMSPKEIYNKSDGTFYRYVRYDPFVIKTVMLRQESLQHKITDSHILIVIDDDKFTCETINDDELLQEIIYFGKYLNITIIINMYETENNSKLLPEIRNQFTYVL